MRKALRSLVTFIFCLTAVCSFTACSSSNAGSSQTGSQTSEEHEEVNQEPLDLTGNWAQKGKEGSDSYMAGYIKDGVIEIFWVSDGGKSGNLYWSGSYIAPTEPGDTYSWDSVNDKIKTDYAILASGDDSKTFSYENGEINYSVSMMGQTTVVSLVPSELDYSIFAPAGGSSGAAQDGQQVILENGVYSWIISDEYCRIFYAVKIHNPNEEYAVEFPKIQITARSEDNTILTTEEQDIESELLSEGARELINPPSCPAICPPIMDPTAVSVVPPIAVPITAPPITPAIEAAALPIMAAFCLPSISWNERFLEEELESELEN